MIFNLYDFDKSKLISEDEMVVLIKTTLTSIFSMTKKPEVNIYIFYLINTFLQFFLLVKNIFIIINSLQLPMQNKNARKLFKNMISIKMVKSHSMNSSHLLLKMLEF